MEALGALSVVPHIGISIVNFAWEAVTLKLLLLAPTVSVGVRPPKNRKGAAFFLAAVDRGSPVQPAGDCGSPAAGGRLEARQAYSS
ncbi:hypothetical protein BROWWM01_32950 [Bradyrhizobium ottawaense]